MNKHSINVIKRNKKNEDFSYAKILSRTKKLGTKKNLDINYKKIN